MLRVNRPRVITILLLAWTLGLGFMQAGTRPAYEMRPVLIETCCETGCPSAQPAATAENCLAVCMTWCATTGFNAVSEAEAARFGPDVAGRTLAVEHFLGQTRNPRPLLPPPRD